MSSTLALGGCERRIAHRRSPPFSSAAADTTAKTVGAGHATWRSTRRSGGSDKCGRRATVATGVSALASANTTLPLHSSTASPEVNVDVDVGLVEGDERQKVRQE